MSKIPCVAVFKDGSEYFVEVPEGSFGGDYKRACEKAVCALGMKTSRNDPKKVSVTLFRLQIEKGIQVRVKVGVYDVMPEIAAMTSDEYLKEMSQIVQTLPRDFRDFVRTYAWEAGHSAGYEEVINIASNLADKLLPSINSYTRFIQEQEKI